MNILDILRLAFSNVRANLLRSVLTMLIIAFGIMAIVGILSAIDAAIYSMGQNFSSLGSDSYSIVPRNQQLRSTRRGMTVKQAEPISWRDATKFKESFNYPANVSISMMASGNATLKYKEEETNPTVGIRGGDEYSLDILGLEIEYGRYFNKTEIDIGSNKVVIGSDIIDLLFDGNGASSLGEIISVNSRKYMVIGVLKSQGASLNQNSDRIVIIPIVKAKNLYGTERTNYNLSVSVKTTADLENAINASIPRMRNIRGLKIKEENDFEIRKSDTIVNILEDNTVLLRLAGLIIGVITLIGAAIGLMNIMLVSVTDRTKEIGIAKSVGANRKMIIQQFLAEALVITQIGGFFGTMLGIGVGYAVANFFGGTFQMPWEWIILGFIICMMVGLVSGIYPATKAAKLDPIDALRYE